MKCIGTILEMFYFVRKLWSLKTCLAKDFLFISLAIKVGGLKKELSRIFLFHYMSTCQVWPICWNKMVLMYLEGKTKAKRATKILEGRKCAKIQGNGLRFSLWVFRYFLKTYVYTPSTPCRDVKFCPNIPLGDLSWNSLTEVMWHHQINGFFKFKILKKLTRKRSRRIGKWLVWQFCLTLWMK